MSDLDFNDYRRLVVKVGSSLLVNDQGQLNRAWLSSLASDVATICRSDHEVLIVSSGAIAIGSSVLGIDQRRARLEDLQAAAAAGQVQLVHAYQDAFGKFELHAAQVLLTPGDTENRRRFLNARGTLKKLLQRSIVPIINENDSVATEEICYGDNDRLAARIAQLVMADLLILFSDIDGLYSADPNIDKSAEHVPLVESVDKKILAMAGETRSAIGTGGMATKVQAARIATRAGCATIVASGLGRHPLRELVNGEKFTFFAASGSPAAARKQWLAGALSIEGKLVLDEGALDALHAGGSLLPVGVVDISGDFKRGDIVALTNAAGVEFGRGLVEYSDSDARRLAGRQSDEIENILGFRGRDVMVHRDELVLFRDG